MNTILISGTAKQEGNNVMYNVTIWASQSNERIQLISAKERLLSGYNELWKECKNVARQYFSNDQFTDGAYTVYLDHLIILPN